MAMNPDKLHFKWDPKANKKSAVSSLEEGQKAPRRFEDYFDFLEQFSLENLANKPDEHVDKKFTLPK
jgi:hypothetical protein